METFFENEYLLFISGIIILIISIYDYQKNYKKSSYTGKSSKMGKSSKITFIGLGIILIIISFIQLLK